MRTYQVTLKKRVLKTLEEIDEPYFSSIKNAIYGLATNPRPPGYKKLKARYGYRIRVANYRIIYDILEEVLLVEVIEMGHSKDIYD